jgi:hypothetical protein
LLLAPMIATQAPNPSLTQNSLCCKQRLTLCLSHQSGCDVLQIICQCKPQWGVPFLIWHGHVSSSGAYGIYYEWKLISDGQLKGCLPILSPARTCTPKLKPMFADGAKGQRVPFWAFQSPDYIVSLKCPSLEFL